MDATTKYIKLGGSACLNWLLVAGLAGGYLSTAQAWTTCEKTARLAHNACWSEIHADFFRAVAVCENISDGQERRDCIREAQQDWREESDQCRDQREGRKALCFALNEDRYDPELDPQSFDANFVTQNSFFPLGIGDTREYVAIDDEDEIAEYISVAVLDKTKLIQGLTCRVVNDVVRLACDGEPCDLIEDTDDWFAQHSNGDAYYCGEEAKDYEYTDGDMPRDPELVEIGGSFKAGRDGDKAGIIFRGNPIAGETYRQEWSLGNAEDWATVLATAWGTGDGFDAETEDEESLDYLVPQDMAEYFCGSNNCVVTQDGNALEPDGIERKYYAPGVGVFLEVNIEDEEIVRLTECSVAADLTLHNYCGGEIPQPEEP